MQEKIPEFLEQKLLENYGEKLKNEIIEGYRKERKVTLRINTLKNNIEKIKQKLKENGITYKEITWYKDALIIENAKENRIKELEIYKNGEIYLQSLSSMIPPLVLDPKQNENILDMAAAPGGKTTQIAAITQNRANLTACEKNKIRAERLKYNLEKQGAKAYIMLQDAREIDDFFSFDQILLDAPCSGSGTLLIGNQEIEKNFTEKLIQKSSETQVALLKKAINLLKEGKEMIYSTCSILACENEEVVQKVLKENKIEIVPIRLEEWEGMEELPVLPTKMQGALCIAPNERYEGFFVAKIKRK